MKKTFAYTDYKLLDTVSTVVRHHAEVENYPAGSEWGYRAFLYTQLR
jgi:hypothetical protein